jgi:hypothetical protein
MTDALTIPRDWDEVTPAWMTTAIAGHHPGAEVDAVALLLRDDGTNRRARFGLTYAAGSGPATVFVKGEVAAHRKFHARNGNLFNESRLYASGVPLPVDHPLAYTTIIDEPGLDYFIVMEDLVARGADPRDATRPLTADQLSHGLRALARLHSQYWNQVPSHPALGWVQPYQAVEGWQKPMKVGVPIGIEKAGAVLPAVVGDLTGEELVGNLWARYIGTLTDGPQTLLHGDAHIGNTYVLPDGELGFLDWQVVRRGGWSVDIGYLVQGALSLEDRRATEADLVEEYRTSLDVPDDQRPTSAEAWMHYRASTAHGLTLWLATLAGTVHPPAVCLALIERYAAAFVELDTPGALDAIGA